MSRAYLAGLAVALGLVGLVATLGAAADALRGEPVAAATLGVLIVALGGFFVLSGLYFLEPRGGPTNRPTCRNCGARTFATLRSLDRREVLTCFACGLEWALPPLRL